MSTDKKKVRYLNAYIPEAQKETPVRQSLKNDGRMEEIEDTLAALKDILTKNNRDNMDAMYNIDMDNLSSSLKMLLKSYDDGITQAQADIQTWANAQEAGFAAVAQWQNGATTAIGSLQTTVGADHAKTEILSELISDGQVNYSKIASEVTGDFATTEQLSAMQTEVEGDITTAMSLLKTYVENNYAEASMIAAVTNSSGKVTAASIVAAVNDASSSVMIDADRININGSTVLQARNGSEDLVTKIDGNDISVYCDPDYSGSESLSRLSYRVNTGRSDNKAADIFLKNYGSGESDDSRFALVIKSRDFAYDGDLYSPSIKMESDMSVSVEAYQQIYLSADGSRTGNIAADSKIIALRPSLSYASATGRFPSTSTDNGYVFCTDGIYYGGRKILST